MTSFGGILPIFRGPFLVRMADGYHREVMRELAEYFAPFNPPPTSDPLGDWFDFFYTLLVEKYRCEYVYKNTLATRLYLERHPQHDAVLTTEFRTGTSRADVAIINDTSTAYEIKTEYDDFTRLEGQLSDYRKVFDRIYVVTTPKKARVVSEGVDSVFGIMVLNDDGELVKERDAVSNKSNTDPATIFDCMRQGEFCSAVAEAFGDVPSVPNSQLYRGCRELFCELEPSRAHDLMVSNIGKRDKRQPYIDLISESPDSLKHACLTFSRPQALTYQIRERLREPLLL